MLELCCAHPKGLRELGAETDENQSHIPKPPALVLNREWSLSGRKGKRLQVAQRAFIDGQQTKLNVNFYSRITTSKGSQTETWSTDHAEHTNSEETQHPRLQKKNKNIISSGLFILEFWLYGSKIKRIFVEWKICSGSGKALGKSGGTTLTHRWWWCHVDLSSFIIAECRTSALSIALQTENKQRRLHWWSEFSREQKPWAQKGSADNRKCWRKHLGTALCTVVRSIWLHVFPLDSFWRCWGVVARLRFSEWQSRSSSWSMRALLSRRQHGRFLGQSPPRLRLLLLLFLLLQVVSAHGQVHPHDVASHDLGGEQSCGHPALRRRFTRSAGGICRHSFTIQLHRNCKHGREADGGRIPPTNNLQGFHLSLPHTTLAAVIRTPAAAALSLGWTGLSWGAGLSLAELGSAGLHS